MKMRITSKVGNWNCHFTAAIPEDKIEEVVKRSAALAFAASLATKKAGGKIADFAALSRADIDARFAASGGASGDCVFSELAVDAWEPSAPTGALKSKLAEAETRAAQAEAALEEALAKLAAASH